MGNSHFNPDFPALARAAHDQLGKGTWDAGAWKGELTDCKGFVSLVSNAQANQQVANPSDAVAEANNALEAFMKSPDIDTRSKAMRALCAVMA